MYIFMQYSQYCANASRALHFQPMIIVPEIDIAYVARNRWTVMMLLVMPSKHSWMYCRVPWTEGETVLYTGVTRPLLIAIKPDPHRNARLRLAPSCNGANHDREIWSRLGLIAIQSALCDTRIRQSLYIQGNKTTTPMKKKKKETRSSPNLIIYSARRNTGRTADTDKRCFKAQLLVFRLEFFRSLFFVSLSVEIFFFVSVPGHAYTKHVCQKIISWKKALVCVHYSSPCFFSRCVLSVWITN